MKLTLKHALAAIILVSSFAVPVAAQRKTPAQAPGIELTELIRMFMFPVGAQYNAGDWRAGSEPDTPISWKHSGIKDCEPYFVKQYRAAVYCRTGTAVINVLGKPTHTVLERTIQHGRWNIILMGPRAGFSLVVISPQSLGTGSLSVMAGEGGNALVVTPLKECGHAGSERHSLLQVTSAGKKPVLFYESYSAGGSGGDYSSLVVILDENDSRMLDKGCLR